MISMFLYLWCGHLLKGEVMSVHYERGVLYG